MSYIENIQISEKSFNEIRTVLGFPVIDTEFETIMSNDDIKNYSIAPALETYFTYFPIPFPISIPVTGSSALQQYDAPENTLGIIREQFVPQSSTIGGGSLMQQGMFYGNPFYSSSQVISKGSYGLGGNFGTPFGYGKELFTYQNKFYNKSLEASNKVYYVKFDDENNQILFKANIPGTFYFEIATFSNDVDKIPIRKRQKFIQYAQGLLLKRFSSILALGESDLPSSLDVDYLNSEGDRLIELAEEYFREASSIPVMR